MTGRSDHSNPCDNLNHSRLNAPIGHCPQCGGVVNARIPARRCSESQHAAARRDRTAFCVDCGTQLVADH
jgi:hypothetical protein